MLQKRVVRILLTFTALIAFGMGIGFYSASYYTPAKPPGIQGLLWPNPKILRPFATIDHRGETFSIDKLQGKWSFIFFGYTHCPDICPITMTVLNEVYDQAMKTGDVDNMQIIFVTVDPERDNSQRLADYVSYFNENMIGLGGTREQIRSLTDQIGVVSMRGPESAPGEYLVDHSASVFLTGPEATLVSIFSAPHTAESIIKRFQQITRFLEKQSA